MGGIAQSLYFAIPKNKIMSTKTPAQAAASLQKEVREIQTIFTARHHIAFIEVMGETSEGDSFTYTLTLDSNDPEFKEMLNAYGAHKSAMILTLTETGK